jgi:hypothetical protein
VISDKEKVEELLFAIGQIYNMIGPSGLCSTVTCEGCKYEVTEALRIARNYVTIDKRYPDDRTQPFLDPNFVF